jgi:hypothetical protein
MQQPLVDHLESVAFCLRELTGIKHLRPHAWRHQLCTEMLEQGVPAETVRGIMGWVSDRMVETYSHTRLAAKQEALGVIEKVESTDRGAPASKSALRDSLVPTPNETGPTLPAVDLLNPLIQAERDRASGSSGATTGPSTASRPRNAAADSLQVGAIPGTCDQPCIAGRLTDLQTNQFVLVELRGTPLLFQRPSRATDRRFNAFEA